MYSSHKKRQIVRQLINFCLAACLAFATTSTIYAETSVPAFPGAEGFGAVTTGGRGGKVIEVTNLNDSGSGSLRAAIQAYGARTVVFRISGTIILNSTLKITNNDITIAGQTAPGDGITISNYTLTINADNVIIRYIRSRMGDLSGAEDDAMNGRNHKNIILDHCSLSWSVDECGSFYDNENFTMQWCLLSESLYKSVHDKGNHGYGGIWGGMGASFHHNLLAHHTSRNPRFNGARYHQNFEAERVDYRNNVIYNWGFNSAYAGEGGYINIVNNYYKPGPATNSNVASRIFHPDKNTEPTNAVYDRYAYLYVDGNVISKSALATSDNWKYGIQGPTVEEKEAMKLDTPINAPEVTKQTAYVAYEYVLATVGASIPFRDEIDTRVIEETRQGIARNGDSYGAFKGIIDTQASVGGWPLLETTTPPVDTDKDGMPDEWETANSLDLNDATDRNTYNTEGYTMLEVYLNELAVQDNFILRPILVTVTETANKEATLTWEDITDNETAFVIERRDGTEWTIAGQVNANDTMFIDNKVPEYGLVYYRMKGINQTIESSYTDSIKVRMRESTDITENETFGNITISPNPVTSNSKLSFFSNYAATVTIIDITGRKVIDLPSTNLSSKIYTYNINAAVLPDGIYFIKIQNGTSIKVETFVVSSK